jgi:hypothetical protein
METLIHALADAGATWQSEAMFQEQAGHPITYVDIAASQNTTAIYAGAGVQGRGTQGGRQALAFLRPLAPGAVGLRALQVQALHRQGANRLNCMTSQHRRRT